MVKPSKKTKTNNIIELSKIKLNLKSDAGEVNILRGIDLSIPENKTICIVGPSGSGKTTLMMILAGLEKPTSGGVNVVGQDLSPMSEDELATFRRENIGIVFQNFHLIPTMTALENVAVPLEFGGDKNAFKKAEKALKSVGLEKRTSHYPGQLSGGEQQRVALARAFVTEPKILMADEPTGNLDGKTGDKVIDLMFDLTKKKGTTLILITHDPKLAKKCSMKIELVDGKVIK